MNATSYQIPSQQIKLHAVTWGNPANTPLVLVHGYPDNHEVWRGVAEQLASRYYVIAYDVRGAGQSDKPRRRAQYSLTLLAGDLAAVVDQLIPGRQFHLVGHDWGSIQSWESVTQGPLQARIASYTSISGPCLDHMGYWLRDHGLRGAEGDKAKVTKQLLNSWYVVLFQLPFLAPVLWQIGLGKLWPGFLEKREGVAKAPHNPTQTEDGRYGVQLYRANFLPRLLRPKRRFARCPVQLIVPDNDHYVSPLLFDELQQWVKTLYRRDVSAGHWLPLTAPLELAVWIDEFVSAVAQGRSGDVESQRQAGLDIAV